MFQKTKLIGIIAFIASNVLPNVQAKEIYPERPTITNAFDIVEKYPEKVPQGTLVAFKKKESKFAKKVIEDGIQARIFALGDQDEIPSPLDTKENCNIFISYVFPLSMRGDSEVVFQKLDEGWLYPSSAEKSIKDGRYYVVFEKSGPTQEQFGLRPSDTKQYFESGFLLIVSDDGHANLEKVVSEYNKRKAKLSHLRKDVDDPSSKIPCYRYTKLTKDADEEKLQIVAMCESE